MKGTRGIAVSVEEPAMWRAHGRLRLRLVTTLGTTWQAGKHRDGLSGFPDEWILPTAAEGCTMENAMASCSP